MHVRRTYCSQLSQAVGEPQFATASQGTLWLLLEHPGPWGLEPPYDTTLPERAKHYLLHLLEVLPSSRVLFIKQERRAAGSLAFFVADASERGPMLHAFTLPSYEELSDIDVLSLVDGQHQHASIAMGPLYLVCTDGKHDDCCAKYGFPIYQAMREYTGAMVWQASHVGGDRFAANVVCFPHGLFYGHVESEDIEPLADAYNRGHVYLPKYRGRSCYSFVVQAAEYFVRAEAGITRIDGLYLNRRAHLDEEVWEVKFASPADGRVHQVTLQTELSAFSSVLGCKGMKSERVPQYQLLSYRLIEACQEG